MVFGRWGLLAYWELHRHLPPDKAVKLLGVKWLTAALLLIAAVLAGLLFFRQASPQPQYGTALDAPKPLPALTLVNDRGEPASLNDSQGKLRLMFYGFVRCPDVCPTTLSVLSRVMNDLPPELREKVNVQMVSVDPEFDQPNILREYLDKFSPDFVGLTGESSAIDKAAQEMFVGISRPAPATDHSAHMHGTESGSTATASAPATSSASVPAATGAATQAALLHGDQVSVVDTQGNFVRVYGNGAVIGGELAADLPALVAQYGPK